MSPNCSIGWQNAYVPFKLFKLFYVNQDHPRANWCMGWGDSQLESQWAPTTWVWPPVVWLTALRDNGNFQWQDPPILIANSQGFRTIYDTTLSGLVVQSYWYSRASSFRRAEPDWVRQPSETAEKIIVLHIHIYIYYKCYNMATNKTSKKWARRQVACQVKGNLLHRRQCSGLLNRFVLDRVFLYTLVTALFV